MNKLHVFLYLKEIMNEQICQEELVDIRTYLDDGRERKKKVYCVNSTYMYFLLVFIFAFVFYRSE